MHTHMLANDQNRFQSGIGELTCRLACLVTEKYSFVQLCPFIASGSIPGKDLSLEEVHARPTSRMEASGSAIVSLVSENPHIVLQGQQVRAL